MSRLTKLRALKWPTVAYEVQKNVRSQVRARSAGPKAVTAHGAMLGEPAARVAYSRAILGLYLQNAGLAQHELEGLSVLELGPGEDACVALRFLAAGASRVSCIDRFSFDVNPAWEREVERLLMEDLDERGRQRVSAERRRLGLVSGVGIEEGAERLERGSYDLIVSVAVLEHVYDLAAAFRAMDALLAPGGRMVHQIDLRDHGMFSGGGRRHPLEFLTIPDRMYRLMTSHTGAPNRERIGTYRELLAALGHEATVEVMNSGGSPHDLDRPTERLVVGRDLDPSLAASIDGMRDRLAPRFAALPVEELAATGITIRSRKQSHPD